jgi:hypothetical protein
LEEMGMLGNQNEEDEILRRESSVVSAVCIDKDTTNNLIWRGDKRSSFLLVYYDPGHSKKNLVKSTIKICGSGQEMERYPYRIGNRFMGLIKQAEGVHRGNVTAMRSWFNDRWAFTMNHYTLTPCPAGCPCAFAGKPVDEKIKSKKHFFDLSKPKHKEKYDQIKVLVEAIGARVEEYIHGYSTCIGESAHRWRAVWTSKDIDYYASYEGRCHLTVAWSYLGPRTLLRVYEAAGLHIAETMEVGVEKLHSKWLQEKKRKKSEAYRRRKANLKEQHRLAREEARLLSAKKNHLYNKEHLFDFTEGKETKTNSNQTRLTPKARGDLWSSWNNEQKKGFWLCRDCGFAYANSYTQARHKAGCSAVPLDSDVEVEDDSDSDHKVGDKPTDESKHDIATLTNAGEPTRATSNPVPARKGRSKRTRKPSNPVPTPPEQPPLPLLQLNAATPIQNQMQSQMYQLLQFQMLQQLLTASAHP